MNARRLLPVLLLAAAWGVGPALPAVLRGELLGHPYTDLYPSVWGLWWFAGHQPGLPTHTELLGFPEGMGFYYSSPIKGWIAWPLLPLLGLAATWNLLVVAARVATVLAAWGAARAWGFGEAGALAAAAAYGCSPFFQGYAVEGIVEGTDGWTLALLAWALAGRPTPRRLLAAAGALALTVLSSWYLGMVGLLVVGLAGLGRPRRWLAVAGLLPALPFVLAFLHAFPAAAPLPGAVRAAMGARPGIPRPGLLPGLQPFAMNAYVGWLLAGAALLSRSRWALLALAPAALSLGRGPLYELPGAELVRFPYRWHAGTLLLLGAAAATTADRWRARWLGPAIALEGLLLGPVEPVIPGAPAEVPAIYARLDAPALVVPGPVARPPGEINPSRPRARFLLYYQVAHGQPSPWVPDFNGVGVARATPWLDPFRAWDPAEAGRDDLPPATAEALAPAVRRLAGIGVPWVMVERGARPGLVGALRGLGARVVDRDGGRTLLRLPEAGTAAGVDSVKSPEARPPPGSRGPAGNDPSGS